MKVWWVEAFYERKRYPHIKYKYPQSLSEKIILKTVLKVFIRADIQTDTQITEGNLAHIRQHQHTNGETDV